MKKVLILVLAIVLTLSMTSIAFAASYNHPLSAVIPAADNPHGGYADTTNKCKTCHAVHLAEGWPSPTPGFRLLRANNAANECDYCHGIGGHTYKIVNGTTTQGHTMGWDGGRVPDDCDSTPQLEFTSSYPFRCSACHSPHDNNTVKLAGKPTTRLLKADPDPYEAKYWRGSGDESEWCSDCHSANFGLHTDSTKTFGGNTRYGHDCSSRQAHAGDPGKYPCAECHGPSPGVPKMVNADDGINKGPDCAQCHKSSGYPHSQGGTTGKDMLKDAYDGSSLDDVCNDCHFTPSLP
jgi:hypothetical protein